MLKANVEKMTTHTGPVFDVEVIRFKDDSGNDVRRDFVRHPGAVTIVPVLNDSQIVMIRNYRIAVDDVLWELPAGKLEAGESSIVAAGREVVEETGYQAAVLKEIGEFFTSPGMSDERMCVVEATDLTQVGQQLESGEEITVEIVDINQTLTMCCDGTIRDGKTIAALMIWNKQHKVNSNDA